jgi:hypothetical protein
LINGDPTRSRRGQLIAMLMVFVLVVLLIQLWLITIALEEYLGARSTIALPTFLASLGCLAVNLRLLKYVNDIDRQE